MPTKCHLSRSNHRYFLNFWKFMKQGALWSRVPSPVCGCWWEVGCCSGCWGAVGWSEYFSFQTAGGIAKGHVRQNKTTHPPRDSRDRQVVSDSPTALLASRQPWDCASMRHGEQSSEWWGGEFVCVCRRSVHFLNQQLSKLQTRMTHRNTKQTLTTTLFPCLKNPNPFLGLYPIDYFITTGCCLTY